MFRFCFSACFLCIFVLGTAEANERDILEKLECGVIERSGSFARFSDFNDKLSILMVGSSSTSGVGAGGAARAYPQRTADLLNKASVVSGVTVEARGIGGERATGALSRLPKAIDETKPDILVWQVGTNDALAKISLEALEHSLRDGLRIANSHDLPLVLVDPQFFPLILENEHYSEVISFMKSFAEAENLPLVERYNRMKRALAYEDGLMTDLLAKDRFHMSALGHECLALDLSATLKALLASPVQTGELDG